MAINTWVQFLDEHARGEHNAAIARALGIDSSNITRWRKGTTTPEPQTAVDFASHYGANPLAALIAAGHLRPDTFGLRLSAPADLSEVNTAQLLDELQRRLTELRDTFDTIERSSDRNALEAVVTALTGRHLPAANVGGAEQNATVTHLADYTANLEIDYDPADADLVEESLADRHAALTGSDPEPEQTAPPTP